MSSFLLRAVAVIALLLGALASGVDASTPPDPPSPPVDDWRDGAVAGCVPGEEFSRVDTGGAKLVAFTFDDGPSRRWTEPIMRAFEERKVGATFFVVGSMLRSAPEVVQSMIDRGFEVGNHSMTHSYRPSTIAAEIRPLNDLLLQRFGVRTPFFRAPGLVSASSIRAAARAAGMCVVRVNILSGDDRSPRWSASKLCSSVTRSLKPGSIVLLHDGGNHKQTADAVPCMLDAAISRGYRIVTLAELLAAGPTKRW
jgi:peptidoglycan/xylan/chitin deacetylase (PgdA/CDA1 family)